jgi:hypothetical protein
LTKIDEQAFAAVKTPSRARGLLSHCVAGSFHIRQKSTAAKMCRINARANRELGEELPATYG